MALGLLIPLAIVALSAIGCAEEVSETSGAKWEKFAVQPFSPHVEPNEPHTPYNSIPATSGWHYGSVVSWGVHEELLIPDEVLVHNLEHGGIGIHFDCIEGCPDLVADLAEIAGRYDKIVLSPYLYTGSKIALTAWTFLDSFDEFDEERIIAFIEAHISSLNAPEGSLPP